MQERLKLESFKKDLKINEKAKMIESLEFIKGGSVAEYCHNGNGKSGGGMNFVCMN